MGRYLLELQGGDGQVMGEVLYSHPNDAGLVDPEGLPLSYGQTIALHGCEWRVQTAERAKSFIRIICEAVVTTDDEEKRTPSDHVDLARLRDIRRVDVGVPRTAPDELQS